MALPFDASRSASSPSAKLLLKILKTKHHEKYHAFKKARNNFNRDNYSCFFSHNLTIKRFEHFNLPINIARHCDLDFKFHNTNLRAI